MKTSNDNFPKDAIMEILSRLSIKSLMRFKCVCKSWYALVENDSFIFKHLKNYNESNTQLIIDYEVVINGDRRHAFCLFPDETLTDLSYQELNLPKPGFILGPYDGIFCLYEYDRITLWNVATREFKTLPKCKIVPPRCTKLDSIDVGFGLDLVSNGYKLVLIRSLFHKKSYSYYEFSHVVIYTVSTNSWKGFKGNGLIHYQLNGQSDGTYLNGIYCWLASREGYCYQTILSFHMGDEVFQEISGPGTPASAGGTLGLYHDSLCLLVLDTNEEYFDMWIMKELVWTKELTIGPILGALWPRGFWKNDAFFIESRNGHLLLYDPSTQELNDLGCFCTASPGIFVHRYKESLTRINGEDNLFDFNIPWNALGVHQMDSESN